MYVMCVMCNVTHTEKTHNKTFRISFSKIHDEVYIHITRCSNIVMVAMVTKENEYSTSLAVQLMML